MNTLTYMLDGYTYHSAEDPIYEEASMSQVEIKHISCHDEWNQLVEKSCNFNIFSLFEWGEYKKTSWNIERIVFAKKHVILGCLQLLVKQKFGMIFGWAAGGIHLQKYDHIEEVSKALEGYYKSRTYNLRFHFPEKDCGEKSFNVLETENIYRSSSTIHSGFSIRFDMDESYDVFKNLSSNHRYYYKKSLNTPLEFRVHGVVDCESFVQLHHQMIAKKNLKNIEINIDEIKSLCASLGGKIRQYSVYNAEECVSSCLILQHEIYAFYYLAASSEKGRQLFASYRMVVSLLESLKSQNIPMLDFGGIDPYNEQAKGVNRFKMGFGGEVIRYVGEYDLSSHHWVRRAFNFMAARRH